MEDNKVYKIRTGDSSHEVAVNVGLLGGKLSDATPDEPFHRGACGVLKCRGSVRVRRGTGPGKTKSKGRGGDSAP